MNINTLVRASITFATVGALFIPLQQTYAQEAGTRINVSPVTYNLSANPGDTLNQVIKVRNDSSGSQLLTVEALNFKANGEEGEVALTEESGTFNLASWIAITQPSFTLRAGEERRVAFNIRVPFNAEPGGHYASVYAQVGPPTSSGSTAATVGQKVGALVLLRVAGDLSEAASVDSLNAGEVKSSLNPFGSKQRVPFDLRVKNNGSVHIRPQGFITINDAFGKKVADIPVSEKNVLPDAVRRLDASWENPPFIGRFTANALLLYGEGNQQATGTVTFWILPKEFLAIVGGTLLFLILFIWFARRRLGDALAALAGR